MHRLFASTMTLSTAALLAAATASAQPLAAHRAIYDVALKDATDRSGISAMDGRIVYEFQGSDCDGYTTNFRFVTRIRSVGGTRVTDQQTTTYEDGEGETFRFVTKTYVDERLDQELSGTAVHEDGATVVTLKKPEEEQLALEEAAFPTAYILELLERAEEGQKVFERKMFDGSEEGDEVMRTTVVVGPRKNSSEGDAEGVDALNGESFRDVSVAYFEQLESPAGEVLPDYAIAYKLYDNGITRDLVMDYGDFVLTGELAQLEMLPQESCGQ